MNADHREELHDIVVVGGGPAGVCAAIAAARAGAETLLVEQREYLGGVSTAAMFLPWRGFHSLGKQLVTGLGDEIVGRLQSAGGSPGHFVDPTGISLTVTPFDAELLKSILVDMVGEEKVSLLLQSRFAKVQTNKKVIDTILVRTPNGDVLLRASVFIDATGDGSVAIGAGVGFVKHETSASYRFSMNKVDERALLGYAVSNPHEFSRAPSVADNAYLSIKGFSSMAKNWFEAAPALTKSDSIQIEGTTHPGEVVISMIDLPNVNAADLHSLERARMRCQELAPKGAQFLVENCPGFGRASLLSPAPEIGFHSTRQILGRIIISDSDVLSGRTFDDAVATCVMPGRPGNTFQLPREALRVPMIENLVVTGREILPPTALFATNSQPASMQLGEIAGKMGAELSRNRTAGK